MARGEHVDAACLSHQHRVPAAAWRWCAAVRVGGVDQGPDRDLVEAGRIDDDLDVVNSLGDAPRH